MKCIWFGSAAGEKPHWTSVWSFFLMMWQDTGEKQVLKSRQHQKRVAAFFSPKTTTDQRASAGLRMKEGNSRTCAFRAAIQRDGNGPEGVEHWAESLCCTWSCSRHYPLTSHQLSLRIQPQETDYRGLYKQKTQSVTQRHTGSLCCPGPDKDKQRGTSDAGIHLFLNYLKKEPMISQCEVMVATWVAISLHLFLKCLKGKSVLENRGQSLMFDKENNYSISIPLLAGRETIDQQDFSLVLVQL